MTKEQLEENYNQESLTTFVERSFYPCSAFVEILSDAACSGNKECGFPSAKVGDIATVCALLTEYAENRLKLLRNSLSEAKPRKSRCMSEKAMRASLSPKLLK